MHTRETRSFNMSRIRSKDTKPELLVRKFLFSQGYRYRINVKTLPGTPDIVLRKFNSVIFVHGCFWHGHKNCKYYTIPKTRTLWWKEKITRNKYLDKKNTELLRKAGWQVIEIFQCELKPKKLDTTLAKLLLVLSFHEPSDDY